MVLSSAADVWKAVRDLSGILDRREDDGREWLIDCGRSWVDRRVYSWWCVVHVVE